LTVWFPSPAVLRCPIAGCTTTYAGTLQGQRRASLLRHLQRAHATEVTSRWRCRRCSQVVQRPTTHPCRWEEPDQPLLPHGCGGCGRSLNTARGLYYKVRPASDRSPGNFESGTQSHEGMAGTAAAVDYFASIGASWGDDYAGRYPLFDGRKLNAHTGMDVLFDYETGLARRLIDGLVAIPGVTVQGVTAPDAMTRRVPTVAFTSDRHAPAAIARRLAEQGMFVWSGHNYAVEVVEALGLRESGGVVRVGPVHYNTAQEIDRLLNAVESLH
ncbi:MAG: aminotransferase class V-fold PLP-dependent enzyme, partial [Pseudomonadota bacterium]